MAPRETQVTQVEVRRAVLGLEREGKSPTINSVRERLGGGSTKILGEILKEQKYMETDAVRLASGITAQDLFDVIVREISFAANSSERAKAAASLAGYFGMSHNAKLMSLRQFVDAGFIALSQLEEDAEIRIADLYDPANHEGDKQELNQEMWLRAFSYAARNVDRKELTLEFVEDWLDMNDLEQCAEA